MRFHHAVIATLAVCALPSTQAFTQGELLLPSYLCGPAVANADGTITGTDGKPKALGGVLAGLKEYTFAQSLPQNADGDFIYDPVTDPMIFLGAMHNAHAAHVSQQFHGADRRPLPPGGLDTVPNTVGALAGIVGNIYTGNGDAKLGPIQDYNNVTIPIKAQTNVLQVVGIQAIPAAVGDTPGAQVAPAATFTTITPNKLTILSLGALNDIPGRTGAANVFDPANGADNALDGAIVYAQNAKNVRIGKFVADADKVAVPWAACGADGNGLVHTQLLSGTNVFNGAQFFLPFDYAWPNNGNPGVTPFTMMGAAVSDGGFGYHQTKWQVQPLPDLNVNVNALNAADTAVCMNRGMVPRACLASCLDCIQKAGSTAANKAKGVAGVTVNNFAKVTCQPDMNIGNGKTTATIWTATCTIKNKVTPVVPVGTFVNNVKTKDAGGNDMPMTMEDQANLNALAAALAPDTTTSATCPNNNNNQVNTATSNSYYSWFTTLTVAVSAIIAARR